MKKAISLVLTLALVLCMIPSAFAASSEATEAADALNALGLFGGTGTDANGKPIYDLDRAPTRQEAVTMLVRLLGKEKEAEAGTWETPFTDVDKWAKPYVGYAYANKLTSGTGATTFGGTATMSATQYLTLVLRALGYESGTDFQWDKAWELSDKIGMTDGEYNAESNEFLRGDIAIVSQLALSISIKGTRQTLAEKLVADGAISQGAAILQNILQNETFEISFLPGNGGFQITASAITDKVPDVKYSSILYLDAARSPESYGTLDALIASSDHMADIVSGTVAPWGETFSESLDISWGQHVEPATRAVILLFSDKDTLCAYSVGPTEKISETKYRRQFVRCNYSFSTLRQSLTSNYQRTNLPYFTPDTIQASGAKNFLIHVERPDQTTFDNFKDRYLCGVWLTYIDRNEWGLLRGYKPQPISDFELAAAYQMEYLNEMAQTNNVAFYSFILLLDSSGAPIGYTSLKSDN